VARNDPGLLELVILPSKCFRDGELERLGEALKNNTHLQSIMASGHHVTPDSVYAFAQSIPDSALIDLSLGGATFGDEGLGALARGLGHESRLGRVDLSHKGITSRGWNVLVKMFGKNRHLTHLNLARNDGISQEDELLENGETEALFPGLVDFDLTACGISEAFASSVLSRLQPLEPKLQLRLSDNPSLSYPSLSAVLPRLQALHLTDCELGDSFLENLVEERVCLKHLRVLDLSRNGFTLVGSRHLARCFSRLQVDSNTITLPSLEYLNLSGNPLEEQGVVSLMHALTELLNGSEIDNPDPVFSLDLSETKCGVSGAVAALEVTCITSLRLFHNQLGSEGFQSLASTLRSSDSQFRCLDVAGNGADELSVLQFLSSLCTDGNHSKLQTLVVGGNANSDSVEEMIRSIQKLRPHLDIARDRPKDSAIGSF
jgi:Leucine-rich repeat (LRR) protein